MSAYVWEWVDSEPTYAMTEPSSRRGSALQDGVSLALGVHSAPLAGEEELSVVASRSGALAWHRASFTTRELEI